MLSILNLIIADPRQEQKDAFKAIEVLAFKEASGVHSGLSDKYLNVSEENSLKGKPYQVYIITKVKELFFKPSKGNYLYEIDLEAYGPFLEKETNIICPSNFLSKYQK